jgi:hypothetical protein
MNMKVYKAWYRYFKEKIGVYFKAADMLAGLEANRRNPKMPPIL